MSVTLVDLKREQAAHAETMRLLAAREKECVELRKIAKAVEKYKRDAEEMAGRLAAAEKRKTVPVTPDDVDALKASLKELRAALEPMKARVELANKRLVSYGAAQV